jgi:hypothetical protein
MLLMRMIKMVMVHLKSKNYKRYSKVKDIDKFFDFINILEFGQKPTKEDIY